MAYSWKAYRLRAWPCENRGRLHGATSGSHNPHVQPYKSGMVNSNACIKTAKVHAGAG